MSDEKPAGVQIDHRRWIKALVYSISALFRRRYHVPDAGRQQRHQAGQAGRQLRDPGHGPDRRIQQPHHGAVQGWWDFATGPALEPFDPEGGYRQASVCQAGTYNVKLAVTNLLGDEADRTAPVVRHVDVCLKPEIALFELIPLDRFERAPCTYRLLSKVKKRDVLDSLVGDDRPMEVIEDAVTPGTAHHVQEMGSFNVRLAAVMANNSSSRPSRFSSGKTMAPLRWRNCW